MIKMSHVSQQIAAVALLVVIGSAGIASIASPLASLFRLTGTSRSSQLQHLQQERSVIAQGQQIDTLETVARNSPQWKRLYNTQSTDKATLELQSDLRSMIDETSGATTSFERADSAADGPLTRFGVQVSFSAPIDRLAATIERIHQHTKLLLVDELTIQSPDTQPPNSNPTLSIQARIWAFMLTTPKDNT
jgi:hypothetical protein